MTFYVCEIYFVNENKRNHKNVKMREKKNTYIFKKNVDENELDVCRHSELEV